ncbi:MAG TPA: ABC transporter ATP-binding protein [Opitutaceae bacterium]|nr:ABC transporter ATP-binding protein [Opitutaceae bacterium]
MPRKSLEKAKILDVRDLRLVRGKATILNGISWTVYRGQHWAIVGPNGCGKTSLLRTLTGYLSATAGEISLLGEHYGETDWRDLRTHIGLVTSALQPSIPPAERALDTVVSGKFAQLDLWAKVTRREYEEGRRWLAHVGLSYLENREWLYLSQGERQRVLIARALMAHPRLLILDEPCAGLDPVARKTFLDFLQGLAKSPLSPALVLVTHHVEEIVPAFTHALLLRVGSVVAAGERKSTLTSRHLSHTFDHPIRLRAKGGTLSLSVLHRSRKKRG